MSVSAEFLDHCAAETRFARPTIEKVVRLGEVGGDIVRHPLLGRSLVLKGGTALNLCFGEPRRLSVDLDFNYIGSVDRDRMLSERPAIEAALEELARRRGYRIQRSRDEHAGRKLYFGYRSVLGPQERIEVDLNFLFRQPLGEPQRRELWQPEELDRPQVVLASMDELVAGKLLALLERAAARDAYDIAHLPPVAREAIASDRFRPLFIALSATLDHPLSRYGRDRLDRLTDAIVGEQLAGMLVADEPIDTEALKDAAWAVVEPLVTLRPAEVLFLRRVHEEGELDLALLLPEGDELARRLAVHPALQWKLINVREHRGRGRS